MKLELMRIHSRKTRGDMVSLQFSPVREVNIGIVFTLFYHVLLLFVVFGGSVRAIGVLEMCISGFQTHVSSFISLFSPFYFIFFSGGFFRLLGVNNGLWCGSSCILTNLTDRSNRL